MPAQLPADPTAPRRFAVLGHQLPFAAVFSALIVAIALWQEDAGGGLADAAIVALGINFTATVLAAVVPWQLLPRWAEAGVPLLDMAAVVCVLSMGARASVLIVLPVLWLARLGRWGATTAIIAGVTASMSADVVGAVRDGALVITPDNAARMFIVPSVIIAVALSLHVSERRSAARRDLLAGQSALVEELLEETSLDRARLEGVLNTIDAGVAVLTPTGTVAIANRALRDATAGAISVGTPLAAVADRMYTAGGEHVPAERLAEIARGARIERVVAWWQSGPDERTAFRISTGPLPGRDGASEGSVVALHDITDELLALAQREDFVSSVSHELRTPLTSVTGYLDLALGDPEVPERVAGYLEIAERNAARLQILIDNLLTAARTRADSGSWEPVDLREVVADVVESQTPRANDRQITIAVTGSGTCTVRGDAGRVTQVVDNIVSNAVKYTHPGGHVAVDVSGPGSGAALASDRVCLSVTDDGPGISAKAQQQIFSRFYRAPEVRNTAVQGTGLGLHISRQIVEALGGTITLSSEPGRGTRVEVHLPVGEGS